jgi:hypothetical protein
MKYKVYFLENEGLPFLVKVCNTKYRAEFELEKFQGRIPRPSAGPWWIWIEEVID